jgi:carboxymethylenebutenolidase
MRAWLSAALAAAAALVLAPAARADDPKVVAEEVTFEASGAPVKAFLARPEGDGPFPAVVVIHEWWGLTDWVKQNAERLAGDGYAALAVDLYDGKATSDPGEAHELMRALDQAEGVAKLKGAVAYLETQAFVAKDRPVGAIGWCMGGGYARELAQADAKVGPTVICYGSVTTEDASVAKLRGDGKSVLGIFGADDRGIPADKVKQFGAKLEGQGTPVDLHIYEKAGHGFMRPGGDQHNAEAARDAWTRIEAFFAENLKK